VQAFFSLIPLLRDGSQQFAGNFMPLNEVDDPRLFYTL